MRHPFTLATALGDGSLGVPSRRPNSRYLSFTHSAAQRDYLVYKVSRINAELGTSASVSPPRAVRDKRTGQSYLSCQSMLVSPHLRELHELLYPQGKKVISREVLKGLGLEALAIYWMDDGCVVHSMYARNRGLLATYCDKEHAEAHCDWINALTGVESVPYQDRAHFRVRINASDMPRLVRCIRPYVHSSMHKKVALVYSGYNTRSKREYETSLTIPFVDEGDKATRARNGESR